MSVPPVAALTIAFLLADVTAWTLRVEMDADGVTRRWLWGRKVVGWHTVSQMERTGRVWFLPGSLFLLDEKGKELLALAVLSARRPAGRRGRGRQAGPAAPGQKAAQEARPGAVGAEVGEPRASSPRRQATDPIPRTGEGPSGTRLASPFLLPFSPSAERAGEANERLCGRRGAE